jgi:stringent starvation protein B
MTPIKPYLIRAVHQWILANKLTPYILVDVACAGTEFPDNMIVDNGKINFSLKNNYIYQLNIGNEAIEFMDIYCESSKLLLSIIGEDEAIETRAVKITAPIDSILAIYAKENGKGMIFDAETPKAQPAQKKPALRVVK